MRVHFIGGPWDGLVKEMEPAVYTQVAVSERATMRLDRLPQDAIKLENIRHITYAIERMSQPDMYGNRVFVAYPVSDSITKGY